MSKTIYKNVPGRGDDANDFGYGTDEVDDFGGLEYDADEAYDNIEAGHERSGGSLLSTPGRVIMLAASALMLLLVVGILAWLLGQRNANSVGSVYRPTNVNIIPGAAPGTAVKVGALAPDFELNDVYTGKPVKLSSYRGKPVWVNFWASWCPPCKAEMPEMKQRYAAYKNRGLVIIGVDNAEDDATVKQFTTLNGYDWTFVIDADNTVLDQYYVSGLPTHVFIDNGGIIRAMNIGGISGDMMDADLAKIINQ